MDTKPGRTGSRQRLHPSPMYHEILPKVAVIVLCSLLLTQTLYYRQLHYPNTPSYATRPGVSDRSSFSAPNQLAMDPYLSALEARRGSFTVLNETVAYSRYARVYSRTIRHPNGQLFEYDVWGRNWRDGSFGVVVVVPFHPETSTFTLIREYSVAHDKFVYGFPAGHYDKGGGRHASLREAALAELNEEARLQCSAGKMVSLLNEGETDDVGIPQDKFQRELVYAFLCVETERVPFGDQRGRDREEDALEVEYHVPTQAVLGLMRAGAIQSNLVAAGMLAIDHLQREGLLPHYL